ncbi:uncharacterized protein MELLADRAFT_59542 [Melampsora larici-populina 98AG31]|uniref:Uncharacterized protein n=1 Tax=Melampsora larici-populina (strain 98AG31 / pathotype 3-4-7) TaxID=747676 RepID=F4R7W4_MELLP|nr:uncharacterized protein MELLADRAFT_59542 [Melampsora larici-populina 98AG31]EGG11387.1 hypothetical protein MELLADRAFT_59542 [Melampsora larici-populina 98AG31]
MVEKRTVTTRGKFLHVDHLLRSTTQTDTMLATTEQDEHRIHEPRRDPAEHVYSTACPHEFRLGRRETTSSIGQSSSVRLEELVVHLSDSVYEMSARATTSSQSFPLTVRSSVRIGTVTQHASTLQFTYQPRYSSIVRSEATITPYSNPVKWKTINVDSAVLELIKHSYIYNLYDEVSLEFTVTWSRQEESLNSTGREVDNLTRAVMQMRTTILDPCKRPSIDITRLIFRSKGSGAVKNLYVPSHILTQFEYFQRYYLIALFSKGHSPEYSETQNVDESQHEMKETEIPSEDFYMDDSDEEWDGDSDTAEPEKTTNISSIYRLCNLWKYCDTLPFEELPEKQVTPWPEWAEAHHTSHTIVPSFRTLTSPKSMYRLADMLIIPELKEICHQQITACLEKCSVISEIQSPLFEQHQELRLSAYKKINEDWRSFSSTALSPLIRYLSEEESVIILNYLLRDS